MAAKTLLEELYFQRACQVYLWALPAMNTVAMREASAKAFGSGYNVMPVWRNRLDPKTLVTTLMARIPLRLVRMVKA